MTWLPFRPVQGTLAFLLVTATVTLPAMNPTLAIPRGNFTSNITSTLAQPPIAMGAVAFSSLVSSLLLGDNDQILRACMTGLTAASCVPAIWEFCKGYLTSKQQSQTQEACRAKLLTLLQQPIKPEAFTAHRLLLAAYANKIDATATEMIKVYCDAHQAELEALQQSNCPNRKKRDYWRQQAEVLHSTRESTLQVVHEYLANKI